MSEKENINMPSNFTEEEKKYLAEIAEIAEIAENCEKKYSEVLDIMDRIISFLDEQEKKYGGKNE